MSTLPVPGQPAPLGADEFQLSNAPALVDYTFEGITPQSPVYVKPDDQLTVLWMSSVAGEVVTLSARLLQSTPPEGPSQPGSDSPIVTHGRIGGGVLTVISQSQVGNSPGLANSLTFTMAEGFLLAVGVSCASASSRGQTFCKIFVNRRGAGIGSAQMLLFADYITLNNGAGWPIGRVVSPQEGPGNIRNRTASSLSSDWSFVPASSTRCRIQGVVAQLTTTASVGNRVVTFAVKSLGSLIFEWPSTVTIVASTTAIFSLVPGLANVVTSGNNSAFPLPPQLVLSSPDGDSLNSVSTGLLSGDSWTVTIGVEEWMDF